MTKYNSITSYKKIGEITEAYVGGKITQAQMFDLRSKFIRRSSEKNLENAGILTSTESMSYGGASKQYGRHGRLYEDGN